MFDIYSKTFVDGNIFIRIFYWNFYFFGDTFGIFIFEFFFVSLSLSQKKMKIIQHQRFFYDAKTIRTEYF